MRGGNGLETKSAGRDFGRRRLHAFAAFLVERFVRQPAAGAGICLDRKPVLQACFQHQRADWLLAHECTGVHPDAQRCGEADFLPTEKVFMEGPFAGCWDFIVVYRSDCGVDKNRDPEADRGLLLSQPLTGISHGRGQQLRNLPML